MVICQACGVGVGHLHIGGWFLCEECAVCAGLVVGEECPITERAPITARPEQLPEPDVDPSSDRISIPDDMKEWFVEQRITEDCDRSDPAAGWS